MTLPKDVMEKAAEFKDRADDAGFLARAILKSSAITPHPIADEASEAQKSAAWKWLKGIALSDVGSAAGMAALALDEWTRCKEIADRSASGAREETKTPEGLKRG